MRAGSDTPALRERIPSDRSSCPDATEPLPAPTRDRAPVPYRSGRRERFGRRSRLVELVRLLFEVHLLADERALRVRAQVGRLGRGREAHLAVVAGILEHLADDDPDVLVAEARDARRVLVPIGDELEESCRHTRLHDAD